MDIERYPLLDAAELRRRAEARLRQKFALSNPNPVQTDNERLIQELQVHQIELEMQNEELLDAQSQLEQTLRRYTDLYEFAPVGYLTLTENGAIQAVNLTGVTLLGRERASLIGRRLNLFIAEQSRLIFNFFLGRMQESASKAICEVTFNLPDASQRYLQLDGLGVKSDGQYIYRITAMDITQRKQAEEALSRSEARYRQIVETANEGIWMLDDHYRTTFVNWRVLDMLGYEPDELFTRPLEDFLFPEDVEDHRRQMTRRGRGENAIYERRFRHKNGQALWMLVSAAPLLDADGGFTGALSMLTDITERKQAEEWLKLSEARYRAIVDDQTDLVCRSLPDGTLTFINAAYCRYFGRTAEELLGASFAPLIPEEDRADALTQAMTCDAEHPIRTHEHRVIRADGSIRYVQWTKRAILDEHNALIETQSVGRDVTERKQMEEELYRLTITDPLTGAFNRRYLMHVLDMETRRAQRYRRPLSLVMFDLDHFKQINDAFGHQQGDRVLQGVAMRVQRRLRRTDHFVRWGGEEFMILTTETARSEALALAEVLHSALCDAPFPDIGRVTASFGVSEYRLHEALDEWLKRVDDLVYAVKRDGRNHVQHDGDYEIK